jgi:hypothetical protein
MAGEAIREFTLPLMVGVITGCYSSIFICSPLYYVMTKKERQSRYEKQIAEKNRKSAKKYVGAVSTKKPKTDEEQSKKDKKEPAVVGAIPADMKEDFTEITGEKEEILASVPQEEAEAFDKITAEELLEEAEVSEAIDEDILEAAEQAVMGKKKSYHVSSSKARKKNGKAKR